MDFIPSTQTLKTLVLVEDFAKKTCEECYDESELIYNCGFYEDQIVKV